MDATITLAAPADRADLIALLAAQMAEHDIAIATDGIARAIDGAFADPGRGRLFIARRGEAAIGTAYLSLVWAMEWGGLSSWLEELYVVPAERDHGVGTLLLEAVCAHARAAGCAAVDLEVEESHGRAARLYQRHAFEARTRSRWFKRLG